MLIIDSIVRRKTNTSKTNTQQTRAGPAGIFTYVRIRKDKKPRKKKEIEKQSSDIHIAQKKERETVSYHSEVLIHDARLNIFGKSKEKTKNISYHIIII